MIPTAIVAGFLAGFFGIGGGLITIPLMVYIFKLYGIESYYIMHLAVGTSFSIIIPTALVSVYTHYKLKAVDFEVMKTYGVFVIVGVFGGTYFAATLNSKSLILIFGIILYLLSINFFLKNNEKNKVFSFALLLRLVLGFVVGFVSSIMGIAGAIMNVPILKFCGFPIKRAIGSAAFIGLFISIFGAIGFVISGIVLNVNLPMSLGFVNIPAFLIFIPITSLMARIGAKTVHKMDKSIINKLLGCLLIILATRFIYEYLTL